MQLNMAILKHVIRLIILAILFVMLFIISVFLFSAKYWPDVYNYVNANITIKSIQKLSDLSTEAGTEMITIGDYTTEGLSVDVYEMFTTEQEFDIDKREVNRLDYNELPGRRVFEFFDEEPTTKLIKDLIDESKLIPKVVKDVELIERSNLLKRFKKTESSGEVKDSTGVRTKMESDDNYINNQTDMTAEAVFPWIASIFVKNNENQSQFDYYCDGAILNDRTILTAARCLLINNETVNANNVIVILGKTSLQMSGEDEQIHSVKQIKLHENFTNGNGAVENDIAIIYLEVAIEFSDKISPAHINGSDASADLNNAITTGWRVSGELIPIYFGDNKNCPKNQTNNTFCATYGNYVTTCPSFGGLYVATRPKAHLRGLRLGAPSARDVCLTDTVVYTDLYYYYKWINDNIY